MDAVVHLAALTHPAAGPGHEIFRINATGTFNAYEAAAQEGIRRVVCASSINALGFNFGVKSFPIQYLPMDEAHPTCATDPYSFSKQVNEETAAYYWRRDSISGVQLRLPSVYPARGDWVEMMRKFISQSRKAAQEFIRIPEAEQRARVAQAVAEREKRRAKRNDEKPWNERGEHFGPIEEMDPILLISFGYTNFWSCIGGEDSAQAFEKSVTASYEGSHPLYVCEDQNTLGLPSELLARLFYPNAPLKRPLAGTENVLSFERARQLIGYTPEHRIGEWLGTPEVNT
jgi:hypothetical protein